MSCLVLVSSTVFLALRTVRTEADRDVPVSLIYASFVSFEYSCHHSVLWSLNVLIYICKYVFIMM